LPASNKIDHEHIAAIAMPAAAPPSLAGDIESGCPSLRGPESWIGIPVRGDSSLWRTSQHAAEGHAACHESFSRSCKPRDRRPPNRAPTADLAIRGETQAITPSNFAMIRLSSCSSPPSRLVSSGT
jgi:hypothetical protein